VLRAYQHPFPDFSAACKIKYERVYLYTYDTIAELRAGLRTYFDTFNQDRTHQGLARQTPNEVYFATELRKAA
jgi:putative transposase